MEATNPYAPPTADLSLGVPELHAQLNLRRARRGRIAWLILFGLNLIFPALAATGVLAPAGWWGLVGAVALLGGGGFALLVAQPRWIGVAVAGAVTIALSQLMPVLQLMAGMLSLALNGFVYHQPVNDSAKLGVIRAFGATLATGSLLLIASLICGLFFRLIGVVQRPEQSLFARNPGHHRLHDPAGRV